MSKIDEVMKAWQEDRKEVSWSDLQAIKEENEALRAQLGKSVLDVGAAISRVIDLAHRKGELWERCQGKGWPEAESDEFANLRDYKLPAAIAQLQRVLIAAAPAQPEQKIPDSVEWYGGAKTDSEIFPEQLAAHRGVGARA